MSVAEMLYARKIELEAQKAAIEKDLEDLSLALAAIGKAVEQTTHVLETTKAAKPNKSRPEGAPRTIDDAITIAVGNGARTPARILAYLKRELEVDTTINSVRTRVSKLKKEGKLVSTPLGWMIPGPPGGMKLRSLFETT